MQWRWTNRMQRISPALRGAAWATVLCALGVFDARVAIAEDWLPVSPEELQMTGEPQAPGASAVYLYRQVDRDDAQYEERVYARIKILSDAGLNYANVEIPYLQGIESVGSIRARTIHPDGTIVNFDGMTYDNWLVKGQGVKYLAKVFTLPAVEVGSIIEYRYWNRLANGWIFDSHWILTQDLFTRFAKFSLVPNSSYAMRTSWPLGLPPGSDAPKIEGGKVVLETRNVAPFVIEENMPPENEMRQHVDFIYDFAQIARTDPVEFWKIFGKQHYAEMQRFCDARKAMNNAVAQVTAPDDPPEMKLRKLYARMQQIHNLSFTSASEQEAKQEQAAAIHSVEDVWNRGYGQADQINWLFLALARAAGLDAYSVAVSSRDRYFFDHRTMNQTELNTNVVLVKIDQKDIFLDPGALFTPFGMLPWYETSVEGLKLDKDGGSWLTTPGTVASASRIERHATLGLDSGSLQGKVTVTYTGLEASWRRQEERTEDMAARRKFLEDDLKGYVPVGVNATLTNSPDWDSWDSPLVAEYDVDIPGWTAPAGSRRALLAVGIFSNGEKHSFERASRLHPIYFNYGYQHLDDVTIDIPSPWVLQSVPEPKTVDLKGLVFKETSERNENSLHLTREFTLNTLLVDTKAYGTVRQFYQTARTADEEQAVLSWGDVRRN